MSLKSKNEIEKNRVELEITIPKEQFDEAVTAVFRKKAPTLNVPGFRRGHAPRSIIEKMYGKGLFYEDALDELTPAVYDEAVKEAEIRPVGRPELDVDTIDENGVLLKAKVYTYPVAEVADYEGVKAEKKHRTVAENEVDAEIGRVRTRNARSIKVEDRAATNGDTVSIDYSGTVDGELFEGGTAENQSLRLGSNSFIPGFEEQVVGHLPDDTFMVNVNFPEEYHATELAGKPAVFAVTLHEIKYDQLPELDDEFVKDVSEFDTLDEYKDSIRKKFQERNDRATDRALDEVLSDGILAGLTVEVPQPMIDDEVEHRLRDFEYNMHSQGIDMDMYYRYTNTTAESLREQFSEQAQRTVKLRLALEQVARVQEITPTDEQLEEEYKKLAETYKLELEAIKNSIAADDLREDMRIRMAMDWVRDHAEITTVEDDTPLHDHEHDHMHDGDDDEFDEDEDGEEDD